MRTIRRDSADWRRSFLSLRLPDRVGGGVASGETALEPVAGEELSGGETTVFDTTENAFGYSARNLRPEKKNSFFVGNSFFKQNWVIAPASTSARDGLGPLFNARSCSACHFKDGRGRPPQEGEPMVSMLLRLSRPGDADAKAGVQAGRDVR